MEKSFKLATVILFGSFLVNAFYISSLRAASAPALALAEVVPTIAISQLSNLNFGEATPGSGEKTVPPSNGETNENASFLVNGESNLTYTISLPSSGNVLMTTEGGGTNSTILLSNFSSYPTQGPNGLFDNSGLQVIYIGAKRPALPLEQIPGVYTGSFTVDVVY